VSMLIDEKSGFYDLAEYVDTSFIDWDETRPEQMLKYPIEYLNEALGGMSKSELIVIGADSGVGKTECVNSIAFENAGKGKEVYLFSLEGDRYEVINRQRYKEYMRMVAATKRWDMSITYRDFIQGNIPAEKRDKVRGEILALDEMFKAKYKTLHIYSREDALDMDRFEAHLALIGRADLIILDHLHYFDFKSKDEYGEINEIMKRMKGLQDRYRVPIVLVSHLRKKDKTRVFPDQNDFHGSSNIVKQADTCIVLAHIEAQSEEDNAEYKQQVKTNKYETGIRVAKSRTGFPSKLLGIVTFDMNTRQYDDRYSMAVCGNNFVSMLAPCDYPKWSKYAEKNTGSDAKRDTVEQGHSNLFA